MNRAGAIPAVLVLSLALGCPKPAAPPVPGGGILPPDGFEGWTKAGSPRVFTGADLYGHIDGGAEVFLELGFEELVVQSYNLDEEELTVELYRMSDETAAAAVYLLKQGRPAPDANIPATNTVNRYQVQMHRGPYYVVVTNASGSERASAAMTAFASFIADKLPPEEPLALFNQLPVEGRVPGSERVIRGPYTLQAIATLGEGDVLELGGGVTAVAADYETGSGGTITRIVADYPGEVDASAALDHLEQNLDPYLKVVEATPGRLVWRDHAGRFGEARREGARLTLTLGLAEPPAATKQVHAAQAK